MITLGADPVTVENPAATSPKSEKDGRRIQRISLPLPARVEVRIDASSTWNEITRLSDVSAFGAGFVLKRPVKRGRLVQMTIPMPRQLRSYDYSEPQYKIWGLVRRCIDVASTVREPQFATGVAFIGRTPPAMYLEHPSMLFDVSHRDNDGDGLWHLTPADLMANEESLPKELRKQTRFHIPETLRVERVDGLGNVLESETTVTENISLGGAAVFTAMKGVVAGTFLRVSSDRFGVTILTVVRGSRTGADGITRLHLEFIDRLFPLEGIE